MVEQLTILAPGLLGASVAQAARRAGAARRIVVWARRPEVRLELATLPWCDAAPTTPEEAAQGASLVVICAPVDQIVPLAGRIRDHLPAGAIVTDVGSVKGDLCRHARAACSRPDGGVTFVGSHPMAGSEKVGHEHGRADLFQHRACFVTPLEDTPPATVEAVVRFWHELGAVPVTLSPDAHDEIVAHVSHLPHLLAVTLCHLLAGRPADWRNLAGPGLQDTTRVAAGDPRLWQGILEANRDEVLRALRSCQAELDMLHATLANGDSSGLLAFLQRGRDWRTQLRPRP